MKLNKARNLAFSLGAEIAGLRCWIAASLPFELAAREKRDERIKTLNARRCRLLAFCASLRKELL